MISPICARKAWSAETAQVRQSVNFQRTSRDPIVRLTLTIRWNIIEAASGPARFSTLSNRSVVGLSIDPRFREGQRENPA